MSMIGILPLDKPVGMRSTACVEAARRALGGKTRVGHGGTLDSTASGLLLLLIGQATRLSNFVMEIPKCYEAEIQLGSETTTDDASGEIISTSDANLITDGAIDGLIPGFLGWRMQEPPQISAVHVGGERAHKLARDGKELMIKPKPVYIAKIERLDALSDEGRFSLRIFCRKGTYIRSLARDIGRRLGCGAHIRTLRRTASGPFLAEKSLPAENLSRLRAPELKNHILSIDSLYNVSASYTVNEANRQAVLNGRPQMLNRLARKEFGQFSDNLKQVFVIMDGIFSICRAEKQGDSLELRPETNLFYGGSDGE